MPKSSKKKIMYVITGLNVGGAELLLRNMLTSLKDDYETSVVCLTAPGPIYNQIKEMGIATYCLGIDNALKLPSGIIRYFRLLKEVKPDLVHTHETHADILGRLAKLIKIPVVTTVHVKLLERQHLLFLDRITSFLVDKYMAISQEVGDFTKKMLRLGGEKVMVIPLGINLAKFRDAKSNREELEKELNLPKDAFLVGCVANFRAQKGHVYLIDAWTEVSKKKPNTYLLLAGSGPIEDEVRAQVKRLKLDQNVIFLGTRDDIPNVLKALDLFVLPSLFEGLPACLVEAFAAGCRVLSSDIPENRWVLEKVKAGMTVPQKDSQKLAKAVIQIIENPESIPNKPELEPFEWSHFIDDHIKVYNQYLK